MSLLNAAMYLSIKCNLEDGVEYLDYQRRDELTMQRRLNRPSQCLETSAALIFEEIDPPKLFDWQPLQIDVRSTCSSDKRCSLARP